MYIFSKGRVSNGKIKKLRKEKYDLCIAFQYNL